MAAYLRQGRQVSLILSEPEAEALLSAAERGFHNEGPIEGPAVSGQAKKAADRAMQALAASTNRSARVAGYFQ